uniref:Glutathione S-transferase 3, mitochondrial n=1 Tax=Schistocephalus solidus TaxID=70667 RepID=A0A0X3NHA9_SCHSO
MVHCSKLLPPLYELPTCFPRYYGGVLLVGVGSFALNMFLAARVVQGRKKWDIQAPLMYHPTNEEFNCIQRAHQNYLESLPFFLMSLFVGGLRSPVGAAVVGSIYLVGRVVYYHGYTSGNPKNRCRGAFGFFALALLMLNMSVTGVQHLVASMRAGSCCPMSR